MDFRVFSGGFYKISSAKRLFKIYPAPPFFQQKGRNKAFFHFFFTLSFNVRWKIGVIGTNIMGP